MTGQKNSAAGDRLADERSVHAAKSLLLKGPETVSLRDEITPEAAIAFLNEAAFYFSKRPTHGEDAAHWSNVTNAANCRKIVKLLSLLPPKGWRPIECAPRRAKVDDPMEPVLIAWTNNDGTHVVGEAYWHPEDPTDGGWWWAGTSPGDYYADCVEQSITGRITHWQPMPDPPAAPVAKTVGGDDE